MESPVSELEQLGPELERHHAREHDEQFLRVPVGVRLVAGGAPAASSPMITWRFSRGLGVSMNFLPRFPNPSAGRAFAPQHARAGLFEPSGSKRSATFTPSAAAMRFSDATLAFARPRSTWLRKLSERSARSATVLQRGTPQMPDRAQSFADVEARVFNSRSEELIEEI